ncbi:AbrB/MazE/SpoVT family DNA-binding domain-containing protein [Pelomonas sp. APW6]|uniref:AbrB/MazE/SpoVT family DNA-binding domain-containing protein n=1 Tax=Roseateles subflavus TaxID=3053353 RepID=A0ABT7LD11_9BURK|nr:AbrB/MazE/SpoVT family DNA-binding domain-containing protein [Pelomonas sp. APW6]MDL5030754.1 AbrB/MazE/SpoVT family DNA-binding domain-containing protein [Pelomonas sp. APW6]
MLAKITAKNQLTLPKSVTEPLGPVQYFDVQTRGGQIVLTPVRIQRGDALRAKLAELALSQKTLDAALSWAETQMGGVKTIETPQKPRAAKAAKPLSTPAAPKSAPKKAAAKTAGKTLRKAAVRTPALKTIETPKKPRADQRAKPSSAVSKPRGTAAVTRKSAAKPSSTAAVRRSKATAAPASRAGRGATTSRRAA